MKNYLVFGAFIALAILGTIFKDQSFTFKTVLFFLVVGPVMLVILYKILQEHENQINDLKSRVFELENKK